MKIHRRQKISLLICLCTLGCETLSWRPQKTVTRSKSQLLRQIRSNYPVYRKFSMSFQFTALINGEKHYYIGELTSKANKEIYLVLREPILRSPLVTFFWSPQKMIFKNELKNKEIDIKLKSKSKIDLLGQKVYPEILFKLIQGFCGFVVESNKHIFNFEDQIIKVKYFDNSFIMGFGQFGEIKQLLIKENQKDKITIIDISSHFWYDKQTGKIKEKIKTEKRISLGSFYKKIHIYNNYSKNFFIIQGTKFKITLD